MRILFIIIFFIVAVLAACSRPEPQKPQKRTPVPATPIPAEPQRIDKATNVSFSTFSTEWPVGWQWVDPDEKEVPTPHNVKARVLSVTVPPGKDLAGENRKAPRYVKAITGDFQIETRLRCFPKANFQAAGLLIYWNDGHYVRFERSFAGPDGGEGMRLRVRDGEELRTVGEIDILADVQQIDLRMVRKGSAFTAFWRADEEAEWREAGEVVAEYPETISAGIAGYNTAHEPLSVEFAYIKLFPVK